jgi:hypothetical protein
MSGSRRPYQTRHFLRRGSGYLLVMGAAMLVSVIGLSSILLVRVQQRTEDALRDALQARVYARSAVETALAYTRYDSTWRAQYSTLAAYMPMSLDRGSCSVTITELDGSTLVSKSDNPVLITGTGTVGSTSSPLAQQRVSVTATHPGLPLLRTALHAADVVYVDGATLTVNNGPISCNSTTYNTGTIYGDVETKYLYNWGTISGTATRNTETKQMPGSAVFSTFAAYSTAVKLPSSTVGNIMEWIVLSPSSNPYDSTKTSADGLYYIKPSGDLYIRYSRIVGTLLVDMPSGKTLVLEGGMLCEPARPDFPTLLVRGSCEIRLSSTLSEGSRTNFNPSGLPYAGSSDSDKVDTYSSLLRGLIHIVGSDSTLVLSNQTAVQGTVVSEDYVLIRSTVTLTADPTLVLTPPVNYRCSYLQPEPGTWKN